MKTVETEGLPAGVKHRMWHSYWQKKDREKKGEREEMFVQYSIVRKVKEKQTNKTLIFDLNKKPIIT